MSIRRPVSRVLSTTFRRIGNHSSGTILADRLTQPTRTERYGAPVELFPEDRFDARPYSVLLQAGLALPSLSPETRWALTPPFHPYLSGEPERRFAFCGAIPRASGFPVPRADVIRRLAIVEPGLSSKELPPPRPPGHLIDQAV